MFSLSTSLLRSSKPHPAHIWGKSITVSSDVWGPFCCVHKDPRHYRKQTHCIWPGSGRAGTDVGSLCISKVSTLEEWGYTDSYLNYPSPVQCLAHEESMGTFECGIQERRIKLRFVGFYLWTCNHFDLKTFPSKEAMVLEHSYIFLLIFLDECLASVKL